ncbi:MAG TPA: ABC transporter substrate-binding protein [Kofleriaceae bacterium]|nr:ABC transporter substrate-binding protein [Kofleriaceae bacterium]
MRARRRAPSGLVALAALAGLCRAAGAETRPRYGGTVEASLLGAPAGFDPVTAQAHADLTVVGLVFDTLYTAGADGAVQPHLALAAPVFDAARTAAHIAIRRGVTFHDGAPLAASDVADSLERVRARAGWLLAPVVSVRATSDGIDVILRAPADLAALLALPQTAITRRGIAPGPTRVIGTGPFAVESFDPAGKRLALRAFDNHFAGRPYLDRLVLSWFDTPDGEARRFETGAAQLSARGEAAFAGARPKYQASEVESPAALLLFVGFGKLHPQITGAPGFRAALDLALDRGALSTITTGERTLPTRSPLPVEAGGNPFDPAGRAGDADRARATLADAGKRTPALAPGKLAQTPLVIFFDQTRPDDREIALRVSRGLDKLGIAFTIQAVPTAALAAHTACDLWIGQLAAPVTLPAAWWGAAFAAGGDDKAASAGALDPAAAAAEFARRLPIVPLMFRSLLLWHRTDVHGLAFDASGRPSFADLYWFTPKGRP